MAHCLASEIFHLSQNIQSQNIQSQNISEDPKDPKDPNSSHLDPKSSLLDPDSSHLDPKRTEEKLYFFGGSTMQYDTNELYEIYVPKLPSEEEEEEEPSTNSTNSTNHSNVVTSDSVPSDARFRTCTQHVKVVVD
jgi:hypothetical protein